MTKETTGIGTSARPGRCINSDDTNSRLAITLVIVCGFAGLALRYLAREHATDDAIQFLIPWYSFARDH
ncbi:hypothetical protein [Bradyrhizobium sp. 172]|uniref:hypothetical protein n=1 Tax=Bradyrhizobium sp. 172 TaxID=2782643 RepID=UPI001FFF75F5|nr:hypothetical protein [Bradyrhizobium sp. 172]